MLKRLSKHGALTKLRRLAGNHKKVGSAVEVSRPRCHFITKGGMRARVKNPNGAPSAGGTKRLCSNSELEQERTVHLSRWPNLFVSTCDPKSPVNIELRIPTAGDARFAKPWATAPNWMGLRGRAQEQISYCGTRCGAKLLHR